MFSVLGQTFSGRAKQGDLKNSNGFHRERLAQVCRHGDGTFRFFRYDGMGYGNKNHGFSVFVCQNMIEHDGFMSESLDARIDGDGFPQV
jgi:hypothetical protein